MEEKEKKVEKKDKMSYEQLNGVAVQLSSQNRDLYMKLRKANSIISTFNELDYLFKVVKFKDSFHKEFVDNCIKEIEDIMTPSEEEDKKESK